ncbi:MAG: hypothetical protein H7144_17340 [Burkholderiales bacterium]|nr:hypothetical protein [Phycisphaerae bacterium]
MKTSGSPWLKILIGMQALILLTLWGGRAPAAAVAQLPDPAAQRERQIDEMKSINQKLDKLLELLPAGQVQVRVRPADDK